MHTRTHEQLIPQKTCEIKNEAHSIHDIINCCQLQFTWRNTEKQKKNGIQININVFITTNGTANSKGLKLDLLDI